MISCFKKKKEKKKKFSCHKTVGVPGRFYSKYMKEHTNTGNIFIYFVLPSFGVYSLITG